MRKNAAEALGKLGDARAVEALIGALKGDEKDVRGEAASALGEIGDARAVEPLIAVLKEGDADMREDAAEALGEIGDAGAVESLIAALEDAEEAVRRAAAKALEQITGESFGTDTERWQRWWEEYREVASALGVLSPATVTVPRQDWE